VISWANPGGETAASVSYEADMADASRAWLRLRFSTRPPGGKWRQVDQRVALATTRPSLGGERWWFVDGGEGGPPALDVLIIHEAATYPGLVLTCTPIGVLEIVELGKDKKERNDRIFAYRIAARSKATCATSGACRGGRSMSWSGSFRQPTLWRASGSADGEVQDRRHA
jgi:hypothetical protein